MKVTSSGCGVGVLVKGRVAVADGEAVFVEVAAVVAEYVGASKVEDVFAGLFTGNAAGELQAASRNITRVSTVIRLMHHLPRACEISRRVG